MVKSTGKIEGTVMGAGTVARVDIGDKLVHVGRLADGARFRISTLGYSGKQVVVTGWSFGTKLFSNDSRARVRLVGAGKHVVFGDDDQSKRREFDASGSSEVNYPTVVEVVEMSEADFQAATNPVFLRSGGANKMATIQTIDPKQLKALQAKYNFQAKALNSATESGDADKVEVAQKRVDQIISAAAESGVSLGELMGLNPVPAAESIPNGSAPTAAKKAAPAKVTTITAKGATSVTSPAPAPAKKSIKEQNAERVATLKAKGLDKKAAAPAKVKKEKALPSTNSCLCGCGTETGGKFAPGHDARVKGMLYKVERGEMEFAALPVLVQPLVKFAGRRATAGQDTSDYRLVKAPVRIPGRPEVELS